MSETHIARILIRRAELGRARPDHHDTFTGDPEADTLICDLRRTPHMFVLGCVMDRQIKAQRAWRIPYLIGKRLDGHSFEAFEGASLPRIRRAMSRPEPLHRFVEEMSRNLHAAIARIRTDYHGDASRIWRRRPSSADVIYRFLQFRGIGPKIATMAANLLCRRFGVEFSDYYSVDISADVHVRRVFWRLGLTSQNASVEEVVYRARALSPGFPGLLDYETYRLGRDICRPTRPLCQECYLKKHCPYRQANS